MAVAAVPVAQDNFRTVVAAMDTDWDIVAAVEPGS